MNCVWLQDTGRESGSLAWRLARGETGGVAAKRVAPTIIKPTQAEIQQRCGEKCGPARRELDPLWHKSLRRDRPQASALERDKVALRTSSRSVRMVPSCGGLADLFPCGASRDIFRSMNQAGAEG